MSRLLFIYVLFILSVSSMLLLASCSIFTRLRIFPCHAEFRIHTRIRESARVDRKRKWLDLSEARLSLLPLSEILTRISRTASTLNQLENKIKKKGGKESNARFVKIISPIRMNLDVNLSARTRSMNTLANNLHSSRAHLSFYRRKRNTMLFFLKTYYIDGVYFGKTAGVVGATPARARR